MQNISILKDLLHNCMGYYIFVVQYIILHFPQHTLFICTSPQLLNSIFNETYVRGGYRVKEF